MTVDPTQNKPARRPRRALSEWGLPGVVLILAVILTLFSNVLETGGGKSSAFLNMGNLVTNVATPMSWMAIMAIGATFVIITAGIDISIGSIFCVSALACCATLQSLPPDASPWIVLPMAIGVAAGSGLVCGLVNGLLVVSLRIHPFIVTMGTLSIFRGITLISVPVKSLPSQGHELPGALTDFIGYKLTLPFDWTLFGFRLVEKGTYINPVPMLIMLACVVGAWIYLEHRVGGRELFAVGGNEEAARFSGLPVARIKLRVYALSGLMGGIAGFVSAGHYGSANTATGLGYELNVIAAAVVGGASMSGGRGSAIGAMLGALVIKLIENGIDVIQVVNLGFLKLHVSQEYGKIIIGAAIIVAVSADRLSEYLRLRRSRPSPESDQDKQPDNGGGHESERTPRQKGGDRRMCMHGGCSRRVRQGARAHGGRGKNTREIGNPQKNHTWARCQEPIQSGVPDGLHGRKRRGPRTGAKV